MNLLIQGFLDNDSVFGRFMTKLGIIIAANIMFVLVSLPFFTIGAGLSALYYVSLKTLRGDGVVNPFKEFWIGLKTNFRQATISWMAFVFLMLFLVTDVRICEAAGGILGLIKVGVYALGVVAILLFLYLLPVMTAFSDTLPHLVKNAFYFICKKPWKAVIILFFDVFPLVLTYTDQAMLPLYAFLWVMCGFGLQAMLGATLLLPEFSPYLPVIEEEGEAIDKHQPTEKEILRDMRKLDGV